MNGMWNIYRLVEDSWQAQASLFTYNTSVLYLPKRNISPDLHSPQLVMCISSLTSRIATGYHETSGDLPKYMANNIRK